MSAAPTTTPAAEQSGTPPPAQSPSQPQSSFESFLSDSIGAALKENPRMPTLQKDAPGDEASDNGQNLADNQQTSVENRGTPADNGEKLADSQPTQVSENPLIPDFSKLAFGKDIAVKIPTPTEPADKTAEILSPEQFPEKFPGKATQQVQDAWASMRKNAKALYDQNNDLAGRLKEANERLKEFDGKTPMARDEYDRITGERDDLVKELRLSKLEATPEYKKAVTLPWKSIEDQMKRFAAKYGVHEHQIQRAITESDPDKQSEMLAKVTETFNDRDKLTLFKVADSAIEVARKREVLHKDVKQALDYIEAKRNADNEVQVATAKQEWSSSLSKAWGTVGESLYLAREQEGNEDWNSGLREAKQLVASTDISKLSKTEIAQIMVQAAILPRACAAISQLWQMYAQANTALKRYQGARPGAGSGSSGVGTEPVMPASGDELGFVDAIEARVGGRR